MSDTTEGRSAAYRIDADDRLVWFDESFAAFARENGAPELCEGLLGTSLWDHISSPDVYQVYKAVLARARGGSQIEFDFRCDTPSLRRDMRMHIEAGPARSVVFTTTVVRVQALEGLRPAMAAGKPGMLKVCAWCLRANHEGWTEIEHAIHASEVFQPGHELRVTHGICPDCLARIEAG